MKKKRYVFISLLTAASLFLLSACGASTSSSGADSYSMAENAAAEYNDSEDYGTADIYAEETAEAKDAVSSGASEETGRENPAAASTDKASSEVLIEEDKIVYTCNLTIQTTDYSSTSSGIRASIKQYGGFIESESETNNNYNWYSGNNKDKMYLYMTVRIPSKNLQTFLSSLEGKGHVESKSINAENITRAYRNTEVAIEMLEKEEERLQSMMDQASTIEDMITVESRLTEVETQLAQNRSQMNTMNTNIAYSTVYLSVEEVREYAAPEPETFGERVLRVMDDSRIFFTDLLENLFFLIIFLLPLIIVVAVIVIIRVIWRKKHPKPKKERRKRLPFGRKKAADPEKVEPKIIVAEEKKEEPKED